MTIALPRQKQHSDWLARLRTIMVLRPGQRVVNVPGIGVSTARDWLAAQEAERARLAAFAALRERLVSGQLGALAWLQTQLDTGQGAPEWDELLARML